MHEDLEQDKELIDPVVKVFEYVADRVQALCERVDKLEAIVYEEIIGGVTKLYKENLRGQTRGELESKYGELFGPMKEDLEAIDLGDIYEKLVDVLEELRGVEGYTEEMGDSRIREIHGQLKSKFDKIKGVQPPKAIEVEVTTEEPPKVEESEPEKEEDDITKMMKKLAGDPRLKGV